nr:MFS transporter [Streptomyces viridiviolaceus]
MVNLDSPRPGLPVVSGLFGLRVSGRPRVAINIDGADVEQITGRTVPKAVGIRRNHDVRPDAGSSAQAKFWEERRLLLIGGVILAMALAEGSANDWLPLLMVDGHDMDPAVGSAVYTGFAAAMTVGRFVGGFLIDRLGHSRALPGAARLGIALVVFADSAVLADAAVLPWGLGASLGFPLTLSAADDSGPDSTARVSLVAMIGYVAFLVGPPSLGFLGDHYGLRAAVIVVLAFTTVAILLAPAVGARSTATSLTPDATDGTRPAKDGCQG